MAGVLPATVFDAPSYGTNGVIPTTKTGQAWIGTNNATAVVPNAYGLTVWLNNLKDAEYKPYIDYASTMQGQREDGEALVRFSWLNASAYNSAPLDFGIVLRRVDADTYHMVEVTQRPTEDARVMLVVCVNGVQTILAETRYRSTVSATWLRFRKSGKSLSVRMWAYDAPEPTSWSLTYTYPIAIPAEESGRGNVGFYFGKNTDSRYRANSRVELQAYYFYTGTEYLPNSLNIQDTMLRNDGQGDQYAGWGRTTSGHYWQGDVIYDPANLVPRTSTDFMIYSRPSTTPTYGGGIAYWRSYPNETTYAWIDQRLTGEYSIIHTIRPSNEMMSRMSLGLGLIQSVPTRKFNGEATAMAAMYWSLEPTSGATSYPTQFRLFLQSTTSTRTEPYTVTSVTPISLTSNVRYKVRIQRTVNRVAVRCWQEGTSEPTTWNAYADVPSTTVNNGRPFVRVGHPFPSVDNATGAIFYAGLETVTPVAMVGVTSPSSALRITPTGFTVNSFGGEGSDTTAAIRGTYTGDSNGNASAILVYKRRGFSENESSISMARFTSDYYVNVTGLKPGTVYDAYIQFSDNTDGISGMNPVYGSFTTKNDGVGITDLTAVNELNGNVTVTAKYINDDNNNSSATIKWRVVSENLNLLTDNFRGQSLTPLSAHPPEVPATGGTWVKSPANSGTANAILSQGRLVTDFYQEQPEVGILDIATTPSLPPVVYHNMTSVTGDFDVDATLLVADSINNFFVLARMNEASGARYIAGYNAGESRWELKKAASYAGTPTLVGSVDSPLFLNRTYQLTFVNRSAYVALVVDGVELIRDTSPTTYSDKIGLEIYNNPNIYGTLQPTDQIALAAITVNKRLVNTGYSPTSAMSANRTTKAFSFTYSGLSVDAVLEFEVILTDGNGYVGPTNKTVRLVRPNQSMYLKDVTANGSFSTLDVSVSYLYDNNNNSSVSIQYRHTMEYLWTTVPANRIIVNRGDKKFSTIISSVRPASTYEVRVYADDPNGLVEGSPNVLTATARTAAVSVESAFEDKHYLWKIYDAKGTYITTWTDAGQPEYTWEENGGVTNLGTKLLRPISSIASSRSGIRHQNRVDIWCLDPSSKGFGPNLLADTDAEFGMWSLGSNAVRSDTAGPDGSRAIYISATTNASIPTRSEPIEVSQSQMSGKVVYTPVPYTISCVARAVGKLRMYVEGYSRTSQKIDQSDFTAETVGGDWQRVELEYTPVANVAYFRVVIENDSVGGMWADKFEVYAKEALVYRGHIESYTPTVDQSEEFIDVEILGLISTLSDDYIDFLQYVIVQPAADFAAGRPNRGPTDPSEMMKDIIDLARRQNPKFELYYTNESIRATGTILQYTFKGRQIREAFDKVRQLCPSGWHYFIEPDGLVNLRGPEHATTHRLRLGVEMLNFSVEKSIRDLKNYVIVKGRQDEDKSEPDGNGSINAEAFDQASIDQYGKRVMRITDAQITDPDTATFVANGRLVEFNRETDRGQAVILDEKSLDVQLGALKGYNIESLRPGDMVYVFDPIGSDQQTVWDQFLWDQADWDNEYSFTPLPESVPIKSVQFEASTARIELSQRQPSGVGEYGRLYRYLQLQEQD